MTTIRVALVDNDPMCLDLYGRQLRHEGMVVECIESQLGTTTNKVLEFRPDVVILDLQMPGAPGTWFAQVLRDSARRRDVRIPKIILFSAADETTLRKAAVDSKVDAYLSKNAGAVKLASKIEEVLGLFLQR